MRWRSLLACSATLMTLSTGGLTAQAGAIRAGIFAGVTSSTFGGEDVEDLDSKIGLEVPALIAIRFPGSGKVTPFIGAGAALAFKVGCSIGVSDGSASASTGCGDVEDALEVDLKGTDLGLVGRAGVDINRIRI